MDENPYKAPQEQWTEPLTFRERLLRLDRIFHQIALAGLLLTIFLIVLIMVLWFAG